jgi:beta-glucosidase-like glycosyl hydrolase
MDGPIQSATLLKNEQKALPLDGASAGTIAVIGPTAGLSKSDAGYCETTASSRFLRCCDAFCWASGDGEAQRPI